MSRTSFAVKLDEELQEEVKDFCQSRGLKQGAFFEKALREQMEREELAEDLLDLYTSRSMEQHALDFETYLKGRK